MSIPRVSEAVASGFELKVRTRWAGKYYFKARLTRKGDDPMVGSLGLSIESALLSLEGVVAARGGAGRMSDAIGQIVPRSIWRFFGDQPPHARGELHAVIEHQPGDVISASSNRIWRGPAQDFVRQFRLIQEPPPPTQQQQAA